MNQKLILDLTLRLTQALNNNYDVVDMDTVLCVISALEGATITKEQLETTRLGNYINQLRRRTKSDQLARRSKNLLKKWREMVGIQQATGAAAAGGAQRSRPTSPSVQIVADSSRAGNGDNSNCSLTNTNTGSANYTNKKSARAYLANGSGAGGNTGGSVPPHAVHALGGNHNSNSSNKTSNKSTKQPTSFANLISGAAMGGTGAGQAFLIDDNRSLSPNSLPPIAKSDLMGFADHHHHQQPQQQHDPRHQEHYQPGAFYHHKQLQQPPHLSNGGEHLFQSTTTIDLNDSNSNSVVAVGGAGPLLDKNDNRGDHRKARKHKKERRRKDKDAPTKRDLHGEDSSRPGLFATSGECLSLSNSSLSIFPQAATMTTTSTNAMQRNARSAHSATGGDAHKTDLTFAGKFGGTNAAAAPLAPSSPIVIIESRSCSPFMPIEATNDSCTSSVDIQVEVVDVVSHQDNQDDVVTAPSLSLPPLANPQETTPVKVPKKRGRKKGSKGVDGLLAQSQHFLNNQLLESTKLLTNTGGGKKVKTTIELYADLKMRNLGTSATSSPVPPMALASVTSSRPPSTCSEPSLQSPSTSDACSTNATMSTVARSTPDKITASNLRQSEYIDDSASDTNMTAPLARKEPKCKPDLYADDAVHETGDAPPVIVAATSAEEAIAQLNAQLPPINEDEIEWESSPEEPCTCTLREIEPDLSTQLAAAAPIDFNSLDEDSKPIISVDVLPRPPAKVARPKAEAPPPPAKPVKSIFDIDYDEEYDPLHTFVEEAKAVAANRKEKQDDELIQVSIKEDDSTEEAADLVQVPALPLAFPMPHADESLLPLQPVLPTFEVDEDPNCEAKRRYEVETNEATPFHVDALHNCFVPSVNGNWDHSEPKNLDDDGVTTVNYDEITPEGLYVRVVPQYNHLVMDRLPKDLSRWRPDPRKPRPWRKRAPLFLGAISKEERKATRVKRKKKRAKVKAEPEPEAMAADEDHNISNNSNTPCTASDSYVSNNISNPTAIVADTYKNFCDPDADEEDDLNVNAVDTSGSKSKENNNDLHTNDNNNINSSPRPKLQALPFEGAKRKRRKASAERRVKRLKIVNGQLFNPEGEDEDESDSDDVEFMSDDDEEDDDQENENEQEQEDEDEDSSIGSEFHEVVTSSNAASNHIVLTIKKTPNKMSSPSSSGTISPPEKKRPPPDVGEDEDKENMLERPAPKITIKVPRVQPAPAKPRTPVVAVKVEDVLEEKHAPANTIGLVVQAKKEKLQRRQKRRLRVSARDPHAEQAKAARVHRQLFFAHELKPARHDRLFNYSSSSSYDSESSSSDDDDAEGDEKRILRKFFAATAPPSDHDSSSSSSSSCSSSSSSGSDSDSSASDNESGDESRLQPQLQTHQHRHPQPQPLVNNNLLRSFNNLDNPETSAEYRTGLRKVDEDVDDEEGNNCGKIQQFKEWHEVLQVHSYNDELLTILPYVVID